MSPSVDIVKRTYQRTTETMRVQALGMRLAGASIRQIKAAVGFRTIRACHEAIRKVLDEHVTRPTAELRQLEVERLDALLLAVWPSAIGKRKTDTEPAVPPDPQGIDRALKILERRARLLGLDMPQQHEVSGPEGEPLTIQAGLTAFILGNAARMPLTLDPPIEDYDIEPADRPLLPAPVKRTDEVA